MKTKKVVIIIPTHLQKLSDDDKVSLAHHKKYLSKYDTFFVIPKRNNSNEFESMGYKVHKVDNIFFGTIRRYSNLLLTKSFYEHFKKYDYMLIYHLDALVLTNDLDKWLNSGYDYIASPWYKTTLGLLSHPKNSPASGGNGGFALKNIQKAIAILDIVNKSAIRSSKRPLIQKLWFLQAVLLGQSHKIWLKAPALDYPFWEDGFWSLEGPKYLDFKVAPFKVALQFSFERFPQKSFLLNNKKLPFGVHAWKKYDEEFWKPYLIKTTKKSS